MPTLVIDDMPAPLYDRIQRWALAANRSPGDTVLEVLETAFPPKGAMYSEAPLPQEPFLTEEICAPCTVPWPEGETVVPIEILDYIPEPHDIPDTE